MITRHGMKLKNMSRWDKLQLSLLDRNSVLKINALLRMLILFQTIYVLTVDVPFKQWQKEVSKFVYMSCVQGVTRFWRKRWLSIPDLKLYFAAFCLAWMNEIGDAEKQKVIGTRRVLFWHGIYDMTKLRLM